MINIKNFVKNIVRGVSEDIEIETQERIEYVMLVVFLGVTVGAFILSLKFSPPADLFPKITSGIASIALVGLLVSKIRDTSIQTEDEVHVDNNELFILASTLVYAVSGVMVGLVWVTPLFVISYCKWNGWSWPRTVLFSIFTTGIPVFLDRYLAVDLMNGVI